MSENDCGLLCVFVFFFLLANIAVVWCVQWCVLCVCCVCCVLSHNDFAALSHPEAVCFCGPPKKNDFHKRINPLFFVNFFSFAFSLSLSLYLSLSLFFFFFFTFSPLPSPLLPLCFSPPCRRGTHILVFQFSFRG